jgi:hypothetical protein
MVKAQAERVIAAEKEGLSIKLDQDEAKIICAVLGHRPAKKITSSPDADVYLCSRCGIWVALPTLRWAVQQELDADPEIADKLRALGLRDLDQIVEQVRQAEEKK